MKYLILIFILATQLNAAVVTRYFSTASAGAGDGTTWADRAQLINAGTWSSVITGFNFSGSDSLIAYVGPGTHTATAALASGLFSNAPTAANTLTIHGCDSSGNPLTPPDPDWTSDQPAWTDSGLPVIATTTNVQTLNLGSLHIRLIKLTSSGRNGVVASSGATIDWCSIENSTANTSAVCTYALNGCVSNSLLSCTGSSYSAIVQAANSSLINNCRVVGVIGSSGNRHGIEYAGTNNMAVVSRCTVLSNGGCGFSSGSTNASQLYFITKSIFANNGSDGIKFASTASQTNFERVSDCMITGNGGYGLNGQSGGRASVAHNRFRDNTSGNITGNLNNIEIDSYTTDSDDATDYVNSASGDYRVANDAAIAGLGYGVSEEPTAGGGTAPTIAF